MPAMGLPLGPRVELSKICGPSGKMSRGGAEGCCALMTTVAAAANKVGAGCRSSYRRREITSRIYAFIILIPKGGIMRRVMFGVLAVLFMCSAAVTFSQSGMPPATTTFVMADEIEKVVSAAGGG